MALKLIQSTIVLLPPSVVVLFCLFGVACLGFFNALVLDKTKMHVTSKSCLKAFWALSTGKVLSLSKNRIFFLPTAYSTIPALN